MCVKVEWKVEWACSSSSQCWCVIMSFSACWVVQLTGTHNGLWKWDLTGLVVVSDRFAALMQISNPLRLQQWEALQCTEDVNRDAGPVEAGFAPQSGTSGLNGARVCTRTTLQTVL